MYVQAALQEFLLQLEADGRSAHTIGQYRRHGAAFADWPSTTAETTDITAITPELVAHFFADSGTRTSCHGTAKKATSLNAMRTSIRCLFGHLHDAGLIPTNPARLLRRARCAPPPPRGLREDEQRRLRAVLAAAEGPEAARDSMLVELLLRSGVRIGSALALDIEDVDFEHRELNIRSTKNDRPCGALLPKDLAAQLRRFLDGRDSGPLFLTHGRRISTRHAQRRISTWLSKAGIAGRSAHSFRHTFATRIYAATGDLQLTQQALTHASITSTAIYATLDRARLRAAVGA
ncbi:MAG: tyrosine-type recombinase/integrase [Planctomycetes bacterium]|nr:tyrosine-type recombinase/integrase [Planctomycetota bacterium]